MDELDRVFDGQNMAADFAVDLVDHGREGSGLAGAGLPGDQNHALGLLAQLGHYRRHLEILQGLRFGGDRPEHAAHPGHVPEDVDAKARQILQRVGEIGRVPALEVLPGLGGHDLHQGSLHLARRQCFRRKNLQLTVDSCSGRFAGDKVQVRTVTQDNLLQVIINLAHDPLTSNLGSTDVSVTKRWNRDLSAAKRKASSGSICFF